MTNNATLQAFEQNKDKNMKVLKRLRNFLNQGKNELCLEINQASFDRIESALNEQANQKLNVVFAGGFSEGKTSIISAWLEKYDASMKIDTQESSDSIHKYELDDLVIIDTPGLFGFKTDENKKKFKDKTYEFLSESHLVLYVMDSSNPIKDSHKETLMWLFRELKLLERTIFILNKFDENADLEDEQDYQDQYEQSKANVIKGLESAINLSSEEKEHLSIVAIAANPYGEGIEKWLEKKDEFKKISHIASLQEATRQKIEQNGKNNIVLAGQKSVISDVLLKQIPEMEREYENIAQEAKKLNEMCESTYNEITKMKKDINNASMKLQEWVVKYFSDLILQANGLTMESANEFFIREIGEKGINIETKIQLRFNKELECIQAELDSMTKEIDIQLQDFESMTSKITKNALTYLSKSNIITPANIKLTRDVIVDTASFVGLNLKELLKFNPWGAVKLAGKANVALAVFDVAMEAWDSYNKMQKEQAFHKGVQTMIKNFNQQKAELLEILKFENFVEQIPKYKSLEKTYVFVKTSLEYIQAQQEKFKKWKEEGEIIEAEFEEI